MKIEVFHIHEGVSNATLTAYIQDAPGDPGLLSSRPAVIICPGGAYISITEKEAEPVALRFISEGYNVFILRYSIGAGEARFPTPFIDAAKAVMIVRENSQNWCIDSDKIILCGFSTGAHVAAVLGATWQEDYLSEVLHGDHNLFKPNALILGYPLLDLYKFKTKSLEKSSEMQSLIEMIFGTVYGNFSPSKELMEEWNCNRKVTSQMPPTFLWTTAEDNIVDVEQSLDFIKALAQNHIPYEFHIFEKGAHGLSLGNQTVGYSEADMRQHINAHRWVELALNWLKSL